MKKLKLLAGMLTREVAFTGPFYVDLDLTRRCNLRCVGCPYQHPRLQQTAPFDPEIRDFPVERFRSLCAELRAMDVRGIILQGAGEPMLHPDLAEMIATAKTAGLQTVLLTNGTLLEDPEALIDAGLDQLKVSLWATSREEYARCHPGSPPGTFERVVENTRRAASVKRQRGGALPELIASFVVSRHSLESVDAMVDLALETGCSGAFFSPLHNFRGKLEPLLVSPHDDELAAALRRASTRLKEAGIRHNVEVALMRLNAGNAIWKKYPCYVPWFHARIRVDGVVQPCGRCEADVDFGNIFATPFPEIWNGPAIRAFRRTTLPRDWYPSVSEHCDCGYCSFLGDIDRVHRYARWLSPILRRHPAAAGA